MKSIINEIIDSMVFVEGCDLVSSLFDNQQNFKVPIRSFYIGKYVITERQWESIMFENISKSNRNIPKTNISWYDCCLFINKLNSLCNVGFRLPSELEWRYAASGGLYTHGYKYAGSDIADDVAWYRKDNNDGIQEVGLKKPNELGLYDMSGNVWEWCQNSCVYHIDLKKTDQRLSMILPSLRKVIKGGSCAVSEGSSAIEYSYDQTTDYKGNYIGLRLAV